MEIHIDAASLMVDLESFRMGGQANVPNFLGHHDIERGKATTAVADD